MASQKRGTRHDAATCAECIGLKERTEARLARLRAKARVAECEHIEHEGTRMLERAMAGSMLPKHGDDE